MSAQPDRSHTAQIVDMVRLLDTSGRRRDPSSPDEQGGSASLLSIRQNLRYQASIGLDDIDRLQANHATSQLDEYHRQLRQLLDTQFGRLRVFRYRQAFSVGHYNLEHLIAGLLRVQYYARQIPLPDQGPREHRITRQELSLGWGVGATVFEADNERVWRRRSNR